MNKAMASQLAEHQTKIIRAVFEGTQWFSAEHLAVLAGVTNAVIDQWRRERRVLAISLEGQLLFPDYAFDDRLRPYDAVGDVLSVFGDSYSDLGVAVWFESTSAFLDGERPRALLASQPARVVVAAQNSIDIERYPG